MSHSFFRPLKWIVFLGCLAGSFSFYAACNVGPPQPTACKKDSDCSTSQRCQQGTCKTRARCTVATASSVCKFNEACQSGFCVTKAAPTGCESNLDCTAPNRCDPTSRRCVRCLDDPDCDAGQVCQTNLCFEPPKETAPEILPDLPSEGSPEATDECTSDAQCQAKPNQYCDLFEKKCKDRTGQVCSQDVACPQKQHCDSGKCAPGWRPCSANPQACQSEFECRQGLCYPKVCQTDQDCEPSSVCNLQFGICGQPDCTTVPCPSGQECDPQTKQCKAIPPPCTANSECTAPTGTCDQGKCVSCTGLTCPTDQTCDTTSGLCKPKSTGCTKDAECTAPAGTCHQGKCSSCASNFNCPTGQDCEIPTGLCKKLRCASNAECPTTDFCNGGTCIPKICDTAKPCPTGQICNNFQCVPGCNTNADCKATEFCSSKACVVKQCDSTKPCPAGEQCQSFACVPIQTRETCTTSLDCSGFLDICLEDSTGTGSCYEQCFSPDAQGTCDPADICHPIDTSTSVCLPKGSNTTGSACTFDSNRCNQSNVCLFNSVTGNQGSCYARCASPGTTSTCTGVNTCQALAFTTKYGACLPPPSQDFDQVCGGILQRCKTGLTCVLLSQGATSGICLKNCTGNAQCAAANGGKYPTCVSLTNGGKVCYQ